MNDFYAALAGIGVTGIIGIIFGYIRLKKALKEEIVEPDIARIDQKIEELEKNFKEELQKITSENSRLAEKIDKNFLELNRKIDNNTKDMAKMQGMVTVMFNSMKQNYYEQQ